MYKYKLGVFNQGNFVTSKLKNSDNELIAEPKCGSNECWCMSSGGNTCGYSTNEACDPDECSDRDECPGYGYWCKDAGSVCIM